MTIIRNMFFKLPVALVALAAIFATGCIREHIETPGDTAPDSDMILTFSLSVPGASLPTRSVTEQDESRLETVDVLVFSSTGSVNGEKVYSYTAPAVPVTAEEENVESIPAGGGTVKRYRVQLKTTAGGETVDIVFIGNASEQVGRVFTEDAKGEAKMALLEQLKFDTASPWKAGSTSEFTPFPMAGQIQDVEIQENAGTLGTVTMLRSLARVDVLLRTKDGGNYVEGLDNFRLSSVIVRNVCNTSRVVSGEFDKLSGQGNKVQYPTLDPDASIIKKHEFAAQGTEQDNGMERSIYIPEAENHADGGHINPVGKADRCFLIIKGKYSPDGNFGDVADSYYRVDLYDGGEYADILRNTRYQVRITAIEGPGFTDEEDAAQSDPINIRTEIQAWDEYDDMNDITSDGQYQLVVNKSNIVAYKESSKESVEIYTDWSEGFTLEVDEQYGWIHLLEKQEEDGTETPITGGPTKEMTTVVVKTDAIPAEFSGKQREGYFTIKAGRLMKKIYVVQRNELNVKITVTPSLLEFSKSAASAKSVTISVSPASSILSIYPDVENSTLTKWVKGWPDETDFEDLPDGMKILTLQPQPRKDSDQVPLVAYAKLVVKAKDNNSLTTFTTLQITQKYLDMLFRVSLEKEYPASGGETKITVESEGSWFMDSAAPDGILSGNIDRTTHAPGQIVYDFELTANDTWKERTLSFMPKATQGNTDLPVSEIEIVQKRPEGIISASPESLSLTISDQNTDILENKTDNIVIKSNAPWKLSTTEEELSELESDLLFTMSTTADDGGTDVPIDPETNGKRQTSLTWKPYTLPSKGAAPVVLPQEGKVLSGTLTFSTAITSEMTGGDEFYTYGGDATASVALSRTMPPLWEYSEIAYSEGEDTGGGHNWQPLTEGTTVPGHSTVKMTARTNAQWRFGTNLSSSGSEGETFVKKDAAPWSETSELTFKLPVFNQWGESIDRPASQDVTLIAASVNKNPNYEGKMSKTFDIKQEGFYINNIGANGTGCTIDVDPVTGNTTVNMTVQDYYFDALDLYARTSVDEPSEAPADGDDLILTNNTVPGNDNKFVGDVTRHMDSGTNSFTVSANNTWTSRWLSIGYKNPATQNTGNLVQLNKVEQPGYQVHDIAWDASGTKNKTVDLGTTVDIYMKGRWNTDLGMSSTDQSPSFSMSAGQSNAGNYARAGTYTPATPGTFTVKSSRTEQSLTLTVKNTEREIRMDPYFQWYRESNIIIIKKLKAISADKFESFKAGPVMQGYLNQGYRIGMGLFTAHLKSKIDGLPPTGFWISSVTYSNEYYTQRSDVLKYFYKWNPDFYNGCWSIDYTNLGINLTVGKYYDVVIVLYKDI